MKEAVDGLGRDPIAVPLMRGQDSTEEPNFKVCNMRLPSRDV